MSKYIEFEKISNRISTISARLGVLFFLMTIVGTPAMMFEHFDMPTAIILSVVFTPILGALVFMLFGLLGFTTEKILERFYFRRK